MITIKGRRVFRKIISTIRRWCRDVVKRASVSKQKTVPWTQYWNKREMFTGRKIAFRNIHRHLLNRVLILLKEIWINIGVHIDPVFQPLCQGRFPIGRRILLQGIHVINAEDYGLKDYCRTGGNDFLSSFSTSPRKMISSIIGAIIPTVIKTMTKFPP